MRPTGGVIEGHEIIEVAARHALAVHNDPNMGLTPYGIASCAAALAHVLTDENHPNHLLAIERHFPTTENV